MLTVAYLANRFPATVEPYVVEEIEELRSRGIRVIAGSVRRPRREDELLTMRCSPEVVLQPLHALVLLRALWLCARHWKRISPLVGRILLRGNEGPLKRAKALLHTWLGACYAVRLQPLEIDHIHVHHGFFGSWVAMVAARLLDVGFSMTLHGSDLLLRGEYLDVKLARCAFCLTVSEYNRQYILQRYPDVDSSNVITARLGVETGRSGVHAQNPQARDRLNLLAVGRLHAVKNHAFLVRACAELAARGVPFECSIAGEGPERRRLEALIRKLELSEQVCLLGHIPREQMASLYDRADVVVLTSRSEGIPLVLMEAMASGKIVLAPEITGIPELIIGGKTGFLYKAGSLGHFLGRVLLVRSLMFQETSLDQTQLISNSSSVVRQLAWVRHAARVHVRQNFDRKKNLESFAELFVRRIAPRIESIPHESLVLQQI
jgi:colanic acid/amylovoran biosynthesis glycosyltransferase